MLLILLRKNTVSRKKRKRKKKKKPKRNSSVEDLEQGAEVNVRRSSLTNIFKRKSSKKGFVGLDDFEAISDNKGYVGVKKSNFVGFGNHMQQLQTNNSAEQEQETWEANFEDFPAGNKGKAKLKNSEQNDIWKETPSGFKYRVGNTQSQKVQNLAQDCQQSGSLASALSPIAKDPNKLWRLRKKIKEVPFVGESFFSSGSRYKSIAKSQTKVAGSASDPFAPPQESSIFSRLIKSKTKRMKKQGRQKKRYALPDSESDSSESDNSTSKNPSKALHTDPFADVAELKPGPKEVVLVKEDSDDTDDSEDSDSSNGDSDSD